MLWPMAELCRRRHRQTRRAKEPGRGRRMTEGRFPPPWTLDEMNDTCFIVRDKNGQGLAYVYFEQELGRRAPTC
jgi:hypothetical protein